METKTDWQEKPGQVRQRVPMGTMQPYLVQVDDEGALVGEGFAQLILRDVTVHASAQLGKWVGM
jgi:hypothetical protein